jgi:cysteine desulfurase
MSRFYFDHNATTPVAPEVIEAASEALRSGFGNASSIHAEGQNARQLLERARRQIASYIGVSAAEIVFTSGGTESNNLAILGLMRNMHGPGKHVITTAIEHPSVLESCRQLESEGTAVTYLPVGSNGAVVPEEVGRHIRPETVLVSVMHANNETGIVQPVAEIAAFVRQARESGQEIYFHSDGVQSLSKIPVNVITLGVDLYSMSAHKINAPKGIGALYVRKEVPVRGIRLGGRHERERRAGTENVPGAVAFGRAIELASAEPIRYKVAQLRDRFEQRVLDGTRGVQINGAPAFRLPNTSNLYFPDIDGEALVIALDLKGFAVSSGAACSSGSVEPSHVLLAMGRPRQEARQCVRFSLGRYNTEEQVDALADAVAASVRQLHTSNRKRRFEQHA